MPPEVHRKLTTILAADAAGYSRLMESDEERTFGLLHSSFGVFSRLIERHRGRIADTAGDGLIAEFPSVVEAVQCAVEVQQELSGPPQDGGEPLRFRIGIHLGDVMVHGEDLVGEGVNLAARLQSMAEPGGILISRQVYDQVHAKLSIGFDYLGERRPKNFSEDVSVYQVSGAKPQSFFEFGRKAAPKPPPPEPSRPSSIADFTPEDLRERMTRGLKLGGLVVAALILIDVVTGGAVWAHWPALILAGVFAYRAVPHLVERPERWFIARLGVITTVLVLINIFSWSGTFWALWPAGVLAFFVIARRIMAARS